MKLLSLFSGIGAFESALKRCGIPFEIAAFCECDKYASKAYSLIHGEPADKNLGDIRSAACSRFFGVDCVCYGFPCQDISSAGHQRGFSHNGERTRSGLFFEAARIIRECMPKIAIAENVKALTSKKFKAEFDIVLGELSAAGYVNYWAVLNARDFGLPQNRERVFIVSIRNDIDAGFEFPAPVPLSLRLADVLERDVPEKFFIKETERTREIVEKYAKTVIKNDDAILRQIGKLKDGNLVVEPNVGHNPVSKKLEFKGFNTDVSPCLIATDYKAPKCSIAPDFRIRKLTPLECWRLQGFTDAEFDRAKNGGISNTQLYKMAGNSIAVPVLCAIFEKLRRYFD